MTTPWNGPTGPTDPPGPGGWQPGQQGPQGHRGWQPDQQNPGPQGPGGWHPVPQEYPGHQPAALPPPSKSRRGLVLGLILAVLALAAAGVGGWLILKDRNSSAPASSARGTAEAFADAVNRKDVPAIAALYCEKDRPSAAEIAKAQAAAGSITVHVVVAEVTETGSTATATFTVTGGRSADTRNTSSSEDVPQTKTEAMSRAADGAWYLCKSTTDRPQPTIDTGPDGVAGPGGSVSPGTSTSTATATSTAAASSAEPSETGASTGSAVTPTDPFQPDPKTSAGTAPVGETPEDFTAASQAAQAFVTAYNSGDLNAARALTCPDLAKDVNEKMAATVTPGSLAVTGFVGKNGQHMVTIKYEKPDESVDSFKLKVEKQATGGWLLCGFSSGGN